MTLNHALWHEFYTQRKKKKIVKFSISFRSVAISCFAIGGDF